MQYVRFLLALIVLGGVWFMATDPTRTGDKEYHWRWGMDFKGGVHLVYKLKPDYQKERNLKPEELKAKLEDSRKRLEQRVIEFLKTAEAKVVLLGKDRILVEVPGTQDIDRVKKQIGRPNYLTIRAITKEMDQKPEDEPGWFKLESGKFVQLGEPGATGEHIAFNEFQDPYQTAGSKDPFDTGPQRWAFALPLTPEGQDAFAAFTTKHKGELVCILLDDEIRTSVMVMDGDLRTPQIETSSASDANRTMTLLRSGPLPLPFELSEQKAVSPILAAMRESSIQAITIGIGLLIVFFGFTYLHRPFFLLVALGAVALEVGLFICIANEGWIRISLPQLAGLALLVGMSVDAFILVFEHIEQDVGGEPPEPGADAADGEGEGTEPVASTRVDPDALEAAIEQSQRAFATEFGVIFWANLTTVLSLGGLYFVEGILSEYFVLLALGVGISLSAAIFLRMLMGIRFLARLSHAVSREKPFAPWLRLLRGTDLTVYAGRMKRFYQVAVPASLLIVVGFWATGNGKLGIDFSGGSRLVVQLDDDGAELGVEQLRAVADAVFDLDCEVQLSKQKGQKPQYAIRVPSLVAQDVGGESIKDIAKQVREGGIEDAAKVPIETKLVKRLNETLKRPFSLISVDQLGGAAALENIISSMSNALWGLVVLTLLCAVLYVSVRVPFWVLVALIADILLVLAAVTILRIPVDYPLIAALLTFAGYSINDSIVVCHSIKALGKPHMPDFVTATDPELPQKIRDAIAEGLKPLSSRVFLTSFTTMLTMTPLLLQEGVLFTFGVVFVLGTAVGTLSSVFIVGVNASDIVMGDTHTQE